MLQALVTRQGAALWSKCHLPGLGKQHLRPCFRLIKSIKTHPRSAFATSSPRLVAKKARAPPKEVKSLYQPGKKAFPAALQNLPSYKTFTDLLAARKSPTLLFQASSHIWYTVSCYLLGGFCFAYTGINFYTQFLYPPPGTWHPSVILTGGVCGFMLIVGILFASRPFRIIQTINAIPPSSVSGTRELMLRIERTVTIPGKQPAPIMVAPSHVSISSPLYGRGNRLSASAAAEVRRRLEEMHKQNRTKLLTMPFRQGGYFIWRAFNGMKTIMSSEQFVYVHIKGRNGVLKLDQNAAWALDEGKAIDKLVKHTL